jgi:predicted CXXCH cytochrome family protein
MTDAGRLDARRWWPGWIAVLSAIAITLPACAKATPPPDAPKSFTGSAACASCHQDIYDRWKEPLMARVVEDPAAHPEVVLGDFSTPNPLVTFRLADVAFTYGSKWKQRYFTRVGNDYFVFPAQWDVANHVWRPYNPQAGADWWTAVYPSDPMQRPTGPLCDGCHSVNYDIATKTPTEWNVGCEKCHGPGSLHVQFPVASTIVNPAKLDEVRADDVCVQCHSQGRPRANPINGQYFDWPVGYQPGDRLTDVWALDSHHLGEETFTHWPDGSAHKNRMQGNDFVASVMYEKGVSCWSCHDVHGTGQTAELRQSPSAVCLSCHGPDSPAGPRGDTLEAHSHHSPESAQCVDCHMPEIAKTIADVNVTSHTFRFITPSITRQFGIPNPCTSCHKDITEEAAAEQLRHWQNFSPWRVAP